MSNEKFYRTSVVKSPTIQIYYPVANNVVYLTNASQLFILLLSVVYKEKKKAQNPDKTLIQTVRCFNSRATTNYWQKSHNRQTLIKLLNFNTKR